ncbi:TPA: hypothetical protein PXJ53_003059 [Yersinia enterocolitica]|uniref:hypothetical protein n=1 Tax=Yersinia TaxID=629 RepID=UPI0005DEE314|nr:MULTISPECIES: hypothetical protein [Yersinia]EKN3528703.1 hypothetical protein [Yersinia enterocolitica]EKN3569492.1 hypothetical protein [Yersinia enterocolitica]EKN4095571.1 hypothetical protein [Yersinia enterocolitica]EKN4118618.1 hypothetical protein [Yersinia enterocolitica]EKN4743733.1 hypothetical protein [Yersinia enterocolitica]
MENSITLNLEDDFQSLCRDFDLKFKLTNEHENLSAYEVDTLLAYGQQWASDFLRKYREDDIESHYDGALIHEFELLCNQADQSKTLIGKTDIAAGLHSLAHSFWGKGRIREACKYLAIACAYLERERDVSMLFNVAQSFIANKKREQRKERARRGGIGKANKLTAIRNKVVELLETTERPAEGWPSKTAAFEAIDDALLEFIVKESFGLKENERRKLEDELLTRVLCWSCKREDIKEVFEKVVVKKSSEGQ